jgi:hypothetical protein
MAGVLLVVCLLVTGCGSSGAKPGRSASTNRRVSSHRFIATKTVALAIERSSLAQRGLHVTASCPTDVLQRKGIVFECTVVYNAKTTVFTVTELDGSGDVHYVAH